MTNQPSPVQPPSSQPLPSPAELDLWKWKQEQKMRAAERAHDQAEAVALQIDEAQVNGANLALRMGMLINGGAAIALLTFVGSLPADQKRAVAATLVWFAWGVVAAVGALGLLHFTNYSMVAKERSKQRSYEHPYLHDQATTKW